MNSEPVKSPAKAHQYIEYVLRTFSDLRQKLAVWLEPAHLEQLRPLLQYQAGVLGGFALLAAILLGVADLATRGVIELRLQEDLQANLEQVVPAELYDNNLLKDSVLLPSADANLGAEQTEVYLAKKAGLVNAVCFKFVAPDGYAGPISLVMGIDSKGEILGVRVIAHVETPGLGDKIEVTKSKWVLSFNGKSLDNLTVEQWAVKKDGGVFDQFSGATITPRKVVQAIKRGLEFYKVHQAELLSSSR
ncbi:electron transport complex subunit RsxG [Methylomonas fluvii]|uniref:Ion-translocating oxidoreductase complex subunit G n=1 Tax=Methylomonas fluvii TaxID=1854564 RepID=A0ABR9DC97_9GAMM|nr:electron transport complex subunit RsxG [Methylomonas fluvii]MBD9360723.1 electron transport complex subunit RsxG [Methylomonas fluvii]